MATARPKSGVTEYTATTGSGPLTLTGPAPGFRGFVSADDGLSYPYAIYQEGIAFETGIGTYTHAARSLTRTTILANINGTTVPLVLGNGTKEVSVVIPGERVAMLDVENEWVSDQSINGNRLRMDTDKDSYIAMSTDDTLDVVLGNTGTLNVAGGIGFLTLLGSDNTATEGPSFELRRDSATPAANDVLGVQYVRGRDASGTLQPASKIRTYWTSVTAGAHAAIMELAVAAAGALQTVMQLRPSAVTLPSGIGLYTGGKASSSLSVVGAELHSVGKVIGVVDSDIAVFAYRNGGSAAAICVACGLNGTYQGGLILNGATISVDGAVMTHRSEWSAGFSAPDHEDDGWVVCSAPGIVPDGSERHPMVRLSSRRGDRAVYGVTANRMQTPDGKSYLMIDGAGSGRIRITGAIENGDLIESSDVLGVACRQDDDVIRMSTIGKARENSEDDGSIRVIACTLMAG